MALKESTRKLVLEKRDAIPADQRVKKSQRICDQLTQIALHHVGESSNASRNGLFIAAYEPMRSEVDVHPFFREAFARGWHVCLPCMAKDAESAKARMVFFELSETRIFDERPAFLDHPARPFLLAMGTSWGTIALILPIVVGVFPEGDPLFLVAVGATLAGAVYGDHISPISDTTILSSAGAKCNHLRHVATQLPYATTVMVVCFVCYIVAGFTANPWISLALGMVLTVVAVLCLHKSSFGAKK